MNYPDIECPELGTLRYEENYDWYEGQLIVQQSKLSIQLLTDEDGAVASALKRATDFVKELEKHAQSARDYAAEGLLAIKNETWIEDEDEEPLTPEQFKERMVLDSISIDSDAAVSFYHNDGDLFWGHCILVTMDSENNFTGAEIAG
ncbi:DUF2262 domain-containing protein [Chamaesiphon sp.]|uniref:DUF2262 domain-containing protein n=1 Tax=Chamaesiphon sp. TaxID=2814140 RepID=UPI003593CF66